MPRVGCLLSVEPCGERFGAFGVSFCRFCRNPLGPFGAFAGVEKEQSAEKDGRGGGSRSHRPEALQPILPAGQRNRPSAQQSRFVGVNHRLGRQYRQVALQRADLRRDSRMACEECVESPPLFGSERPFDVVHRPLFVIVFVDHRRNRYSKFRIVPICCLSAIRARKM